MFFVDMELDRIIGDALRRRSSDIHFDAVPEGLHIRCRVDGLLQHMEYVLRPYAEQLVNRIKVVSGLDISEKRIPQDGRWVWQQDGTSAVMRVSTLPSLQGETVVCRLMGNEGASRTLPELGMNESLVQAVEEVLRRPYGLVLVCGPTGSGKTATLYALLRMIAKDTDNVISLEDPVEATIPGVVQVPVNERAGLTFAAGLRAMLRQDPDSLMVGEIRDKETAELAIQAALTGHRVISTIHTNTALGVRERLIDMGVDPYLIQATIVGVVSQRLVRVFGTDGTHLEGRTAVYEVLIVPKGEPSWKESRKWVLQDLESSARDLVRCGRTTPAELYRVGLGGGYHA